MCTKIDVISKQIAYLNSLLLHKSGKTLYGDIIPASLGI